MQIVQSLVNAVVQLVIMSIIPFIWWLCTARKKEGFLRWIGLKKVELKQGFIKGIAGVIVVCIGYILSIGFIMTNVIGLASTATSQFMNVGWGGLPSILVYAVIQTGLSEELFFRGFLGKRLIHQFGFKIGNTIQAFLFGLVHGIPFGLVTGSVMVVILLTILPAVIGWLQGWINEEKANGSIIPSWVLHSVMNILSALSQAL